MCASSISSSSDSCISSTIASSNFSLSLRPEKERTLSYKMTRENTKIALKVSSTIYITSCITSWKLDSCATRCETLRRGSSGRPKWSLINFLNRKLFVLKFSVNLLPRLLDSKGNYLLIECKKWSHDIQHFIVSLTEERNYNSMLPYFPLQLGFFLRVLGFCNWKFHWFVFWFGTKVKKMLDKNCAGALLKKNEW